MPALKESYDYKDLKKKQRNMRRSARDKQRTKQADYKDKETKQSTF